VPSLRESISLLLKVSEYIAVIAVTPRGDPSSRALVSSPRPHVLTIELDQVEGVEEHAPIVPSIAEARAAHLRSRCAAVTAITKCLIWPSSVNRLTVEPMTLSYVWPHQRWMRVG
jgi:hypothetical protein